MTNRPRATGTAEVKRKIRGHRQGRGERKRDRSPFAGARNRKFSLVERAEGEVGRCALEKAGVARASEPLFYEHHGPESCKATLPVVYREVVTRK